MALHIMLRGGINFHHELRHDLESVLYVIIWICCHMIGPEMEREDPEKLEIRKWCDMGLGLRELGHRKLAHIVDAEGVILKEFTPYWEDFKPFLRRLIKAFWPGTVVEANSITPGKMVAILQEAIVTVQEPADAGDSIVDQDVQSPLPQSYITLANSKRNRQGQDTVVSKRRRHGTKSRALDYNWNESVGAGSPNDAIVSTMDDNAQWSPDGTTSADNF